MLDQEQHNRRIQERADILESITDGFFSINREWRITYVNSLAARNMGYPPEELLGLNFWETYPRLHGTHIETNYRLAMDERKVVQFESRGVYQSGWFNVSLYPSAEGLSVFWQDITESKRLQDEVRSLALFPEENPNPILRVSAAGELLYANLPGKTLMLRWSGGIDLPDELLDAAALALSQEADQELEIESEGRAFLFTVAPVKDHGYVNLYGTEITDRKRADDLLLAYTRQLKLSNQALEDFAFTASHDLREPLRKVKAFTSRLVKQLGERLDEESLDYLTRMDLAVDRMQNMLDGLLAYSRVTNQGKPFEEVDLNQLAAEALSDLEMELKDSGGSVEVGALPVIQADALQMRQLLQNLLSNAIKFHRPGVPPLVRVTSRSRLDGCVELSVEDNGIGFEMAQAEQLFKPFHRLVGKSAYEGTGMGLAICQKIAERHQGTITVRGEPGAGAAFTVTLPSSRG